MKERLVKLVRSNHLEDFALSLLVGFIYTKRSVLRTDARIAKKHFFNHSTKKLHIGCGENILKDWLNSDYYPQSDNIICLDSTRPFPFESNVFDYIFSEHMVEHITYPQGLQMLSECYRVLNSGGKIRIATPDLSFLIDLYSTDKSELQKEYLKYITKNVIDSAPCCEDTFVINNFMMGFKHKFIYDEKTLRYSLEKVGFIKISKYEVSKSEDDELRNLENISHMPEGFLKLETIVLEAIKP